jgi:hypothetical protein
LVVELLVLLRIHLDDNLMGRLYMFRAVLIQYFIFYRVS